MPYMYTEKKNRWKMQIWYLIIYSAIHTSLLLNLILYVYYQSCWTKEFLEWYVHHYPFFWKHDVVTVGKKSIYTTEWAEIIIDICIFSATILSQTLFINSKALTWETPLDNSFSHPAYYSPLYFIYFFLCQDQ